MARRRREPVWVDRLVVDAVHWDLLRTHGGLRGLRDESALESALARPRNLWAYRKKVDGAALAAAYGYGLVINHPFRDGNKRVAFLTLAVFLELNDFDFEATEEEIVRVMLALASGGMSQVSLARWIRKHLRT